jgi:hypothetical protein
MESWSAVEVTFKGQDATVILSSSFVELQGSTGKRRPGKIWEEARHAVTVLNEGDPV